MCSCKNKGIKANQAPVINGSFSARSANVRYSNNDFVTKYYIGETKDYIGTATGIDYGIRTFNAKSMVNVLDAQADAYLFSDTQQELVPESRNIINISLDEPIETPVHEPTVETVETVRSKKPTTRKKVEDNV